MEAKKVLLKKAADERFADLPFSKQTHLQAAATTHLDTQEAILSLQLDSNSIHYLNANDSGLTEQEEKKLSLQRLVPDKKGLYQALEQLIRSVTCGMRGLVE